MKILEHSVTSQFSCNCLSLLFSVVILKVRCHHSYNRGIRQVYLRLANALKRITEIHLAEQFHKGDVIGVVAVATSLGLEVLFHLYGGSIFCLSLTQSLASLQWSGVSDQQMLHLAKKKLPT